MKGYIFSLHIVLLFSVSLMVCAQNQKIEVKVGGVVDGDTVTVLMPDYTQKTIQIKGIDAPELEQPFGSEARQQLSDLVLGKKVSLEYVKPKADGKFYGKLFLDGQDVASTMLKTGFAWLDDEQDELLNPNDENAYNSLEIDARRQGTGLWRDSAPQPPWEFRKNFVPENMARRSNIHNTLTFEGQVKEVIDGATISIKMSDNSRLVICISRLETPEPGQPKTDIAEQHLKDLLLQKNVRVKITGFPEDEICTSADVYLNDININLQMVRDGVAWVNKNYNYPEGYYTYEAAEQAARSERRGIWENAANIPVPPWEYRDQYYRAVESGGVSAGAGYIVRGYGASYGGTGTVFVHGYTRADGTYVNSYTRRSPGGGSSRSSLGGGRKH